MVSAHSGELSIGIRRAEFIMFGPIQWRRPRESVCGTLHRSTARPRAQVHLARLQHTLATSGKPLPVAYTQQVAGRCGDANINNERQLDVRRAALRGAHLTCCE